MNPANQFTPDQQQYLSGFVAGSDLARSALGLPTFANLKGSAVNAAGSAAPTNETLLGPDAIHRAAQDAFLADGKKLSVEEQAKRTKNPLDMWDEVCSHAEQGRFPKGTDVFAFKYHGLFYVAPAQDSYMCRLRLVAGMVPTYQWRRIAEVAEQYAGGYADVTTRANLQLREISAANAINVLSELHECGVVPRGSGADNIRNITATPTAGIDRQELIDTRPLARQMHDTIVHQRDLYGLPRKFNIAFDGGGTVSALEDTNDIGFAAVRVGEGQDVAPGVYFRLLLGGITGHGDFAQDSGVLLEPKQCVPLAAALVRVFIQHGDRTDRQRARLKYVLERLGVEKFLALAEERFGQSLRRFPLDRCESRLPVEKHAHVGFHPQRQADRWYVGVTLPVGRLTVTQMRGLATIAERYGTSLLRLTVWQNVLISDITTEDIPAVKSAIEQLGLHWSASHVRGALVACTGNRGCKFAAADTKGHALAIAEYLEQRLELDQPINIHLTGCHHSCAQHYVGDLGLLATKVSVGDEMVEGYHLYLGGGYAGDRSIAREIERSVPFADVPGRLEAILRTYLAARLPGESFRDFTHRYSIDEMRELQSNLLQLTSADL